MQDLLELADIVARRVIFTDVEFGFSVTGIEDTVAHLVGTSELSGGFPDYLREVRVLWVGGVVISYVQNWLVDG